MASIDFPCSLPKPQRRPTSQAFEDMNYTNDVAGGPPVVELQDDQQWSNITVEWLLTKPQYQGFLYFFRNVLRRGSKLFNLTINDIQVGDESFEVYMRTYSVKTDGPFLRVGATLIALEEQFDECTLESIYNLYNFTAIPNLVLEQTNLIIQSIENDNG